MPIRISQKGSFESTTILLNEAKKKKWLKELDKFGRMGVEALRQATPKDTGLTSESWSYEIHKTNYGLYKIVWTNSNTNKWANVAVLIQYGHATRNGGYVVGIDYINPAMKPILDKITERIWEVTLT